MAASLGPVPGATLVIWRLRPVDAFPTLTVLGRLAAEPWPRAIELSPAAWAFSPRAVLLTPEAFAPSPKAVLEYPEA